jgi:hypothetical protein
MIEQFIEFLTSPEINTPLYHFTDHRNLPSIDQFGLVSKAWARQYGLRIKYPGGNEISHLADWMKDLDDYVTLCLAAEHPVEYAARMEGRIEQSTFLQINPGILREHGVKITLDVANKPGIPLLDPVDALKEIDFEVLYTKRDWRDPAIQERLRAARKCEVLVPSRIPREMIVGGL